MKILIIEDSHAIVETVILSFKLRWPEATVVSAETGQQGIEMAVAEKPSVIMLDLGLPDITGFEVLEKVRLFSNVPVLILTARGDEREIIKGLNCGADDYIVKPFNHKELLARVKTLLRRTGGEIA